MALTDVLQRRVRASKEDADMEELAEISSSEKEDIGSEDRSNSSEAGGNLDSAEDKTEDSENSDDDQSKSSPFSPSSPLTQISFGALASAQSSLNLKRKRSSPSQALPHRSTSPFAEALERRAGKKDNRTHARPSKHAPTELSSKKAVSRKRSIVATPTITHRDPRFDNLSGSLDTNKVSANYAFLNDYRLSEIAALKASIRSTKDPTAKEALKRELLAMESREKTRKDKEVQQEVLREHRRKEKEAVASGKQPYYLKRREQKKLALVKNFEGLGEKKVKKVIERRRKKKAGKERRNMPVGRRGEGGGEGSSRG